MTDQIRPLADLRDTGLLWLINKVVFHPRGFALALVYREDGGFAYWALQGDGSEPWRFDDAIDEEQFPRAEATLRAATTAAKRLAEGDKPNAPDLPIPGPTPHTPDLPTSL